MSRRDYLRAAEIVRQADYLDAEQRLRLFDDLAAWFAADNPRFDPERFYLACAAGDSLSRRIAA
jgi:hypothetical protein